MTSIDRRLLLVALIAGLLFAGPALCLDQKLLEPTNLEGTIVQLAQCYPKLTPSQAGTIVGTKLAKFVAEWVNLEERSYKDGLHRGKKIANGIKKGHIDKESAFEGIQD